MLGCMVHVLKHKIPVTMRDGSTGCPSEICADMPGPEKQHRQETDPPIYAKLREEPFKISVDQRIKELSNFGFVLRQPLNQA